MADLADLDFKSLASTPLTVNLLHPVMLGKGVEEELEHDGKKFTFEIFAQDSEEYRAVDLEESRKAAKVAFNKTSDQVDRLLTLQESTRRKIAACVKSGSIYENGAWVKVNKDNALDYLTRYEWIAEQLNAAMGDREKLMKDAKKK